MLKIDRELREVFTEPPMIAYRRNRNLRDMIGSNTIVNNKKVLKKKQKVGKCEPCNSRGGNLCCKQIRTTTSFKSAQNNRIFNILHNVNCKSTNVIYLMECTLCLKSQYIGKAEWTLNRRINSHRNDVWRVDGPPCDKHFQLPNHNFTKHAKFTIIEKLEKPSSSKTYNRKLLEHKEDLWMQRLETIIPKGLNVSYNYPQDIIASC